MKHVVLGSAFFSGSSPLAAPRTAMGSGLAAHAPLTGLAGTDLSGRFCYWRGASGRRYVFSVFPRGGRRWADQCPRFEGAVILAVAHGPGEARRILRVGETGRHLDPPLEDGRLREAIAAGADEIHVHLLTEDSTARAAIIRDLEV